MFGGGSMKEGEKNIQRVHAPVRHCGLTSDLKSFCKTDGAKTHRESDLSDREDSRQQTAAHLYY